MAKIVSVVGGKNVHVHVTVRSVRQSIGVGLVEYQLDFIRKFEICLIMEAHHASLLNSLPSPISVLALVATRACTSLLLQHALKQDTHSILLALIVSKRPRPHGSLQST